MPDATTITPASPRSSAAASAEACPTAPPTNSAWPPPKTPHIHDLHATIIHFMGIDHEHLTCRYARRDFRLTDASMNVVKGLVA
jgi:hypothetical protein